MECQPRQRPQKFPDSHTSARWPHAPLGRARGGGRSRGTGRAVGEAQRSVFQPALLTKASEKVDREQKLTARAGQAHAGNGGGWR